MNKDQLYHEAISIIGFIEVLDIDDNHFKYLRKKMLDMANSILRLEVFTDG